MRLNTAVILFILLFLCLFCGKNEQITSADKDVPGEPTEKQVSTAVVKVINGVKHVHNTAPKWGENSRVRLELVRKFGQFYKPFDISLDSNGNVYVADSGNHRVQKFSPDGEFLSSYGRKGQGPGEFQIMGGIAVDNEDNVYLAFATRNKIEKYTPEGTLRMTIDRPLNYGISEKIEKVKRQVGPREIELPQLNFVSKSLAIDEKYRIWVLSYDRQLTFEELPVTIHFADEAGQLEATDTLKTSESSQTDAFAFHVFERTGEFLGEIPLTHFADKVKIFGDRLYILEKDNEMCVYEYRIVNTI